MTWGLMSDNAISNDDREALAEFVLTSDRLTQGPVVKEFERAWSNWQGCKYSVFVNSGSSANLLINRALGVKYNTWVCQASTWITNVSPVIQNNQNLFLCDISMSNLGPDLDMLEDVFATHKNVVLFLTHFIGYSAISDDLLELCSKYNVTLVEDCCESHGAEFNGKKIGNFGIASSFSFYYGHHMTTIEGGMICTDGEDLYHQFLLLRSHGMLRELPEPARSNYAVEGIDPKFTFLRDAYNVRSSDINAFLGIRQLSRLDENIKVRNINYKRFKAGLDRSKYYLGDDGGLSSFCLPLICKKEILDNVRTRLDNANIEHRPFIGGNLYTHPVFGCIAGSERCVPNAEYMKTNCVYVGNHQEVTDDMVDMLLAIVNGVD
jgi:CDP-6-deoxy-D-xylo-4-hexulose-3-dehydrase